MTNTFGTKTLSLGGNHASDFKMTFHASFHDYIGVCQCVELFIACLFPSFTLRLVEFF